MTDQYKERKAARRRVHAFGYHLIGYFMAMIILMPINVQTTPNERWFVLPLVGWGAFLALHVAYAINLFSGRT